MFNAGLYHFIKNKGEQVKTTYDKELLTNIKKFTQKNNLFIVIEHSKQSLFFLKLF